MNENIVVPIAGMVMIITLALGVPYVRGLVRRWEKSASAPPIPADVTGRLERIEHAIEAVAVEVERISEGQRFTTKLLAEKADAVRVNRNA